MFNKKILLSLGASIIFASLVNATSLNDEFLRKTNAILNGKIDRAELTFKADGRQGKEAYWVMSRKQFDALKELIKYVTSSYTVITENKKKYIRFTDKLSLERNNHFCGIKKPSLVQKLIMCAKTKNIEPLMKDDYIHNADSNDYSHVAIRANLQIKECAVADKTVRVYRNVPQKDQPGNLSGLYLRGNADTIDKGDLIGFSYRAQKNGLAKDYFFGDLVRDTTDRR